MSSLATLVYVMEPLPCRRSGARAWWNLFPAVYSNALVQGKPNITLKYHIQYFCFGVVHFNSTPSQSICGLPVDLVVITAYQAIFLFTQPGVEGKTCIRKSQSLGGSIQGFILTELLYQISIPERNFVLEIMTILSEWVLHLLLWLLVGLFKKNAMIVFA